MAGLPPIGKEGSGTPVFKILVRALVVGTQKNHPKQMFKLMDKKLFTILCSFFLLRLDLTQQMYRCISSFVQKMENLFHG